MMLHWFHHLDLHILIGNFHFQMDRMTASSMLTPWLSCLHCIGVFLPMADHKWIFGLSLARSPGTADNETQVPSASAKKTENHPAWNCILRSNQMQLIAKDNQGYWGSLCESLSAFIARMGPVCHHKKELAHVAKYLDVVLDKVLRTGKRIIQLPWRTTNM